MSFHYRYRKVLLGFALTLVITLSSMGIYFKFFRSPSKITKEKMPVLASVTETEKETLEEEKYYVDIKGQVVNPGLYQVSSTARVMDVINVAGGLLETSDTSVMNLGKQVFDEMVIVVYSKDEVANFVKTKEEEIQKIEQCQEQNNIVNDACIDLDSKDEIPEGQETSMVSINQGTKEQLMTLPGIGEAKAEDIITYREENGLFEKIEDIMNVSGIGEAVFAKIKDYITV